MLERGAVLLALAALIALAVLAVRV